MKKTKFVVIIFMLAIITACSYFDEKDVIATISGRNVTQQEFDAYLKFKSIRVRDNKHRQALLDQYLEKEALSEVIEKNFDDNIRQTTEAELAEFNRQMNISRYFETYLKETVTEQKIQDYYATNSKQYSDTKVQVAHVLFRLNKKMTEAERQAKLTTATEAWSKLKAGEDFAKIANDYSEDRISAKKGGDLGWLKKGAIDPKFSQKIFELKKDEISAPFETSFGYHLVKVIQEPKTVKKSFESVKGDIRYLLRQKSKQVELERLKKSASIELRS